MVAWRAGEHAAVDSEALLAADSIERRIALEADHGAHRAQVEQRIGHRSRERDGVSGARNERGGRPIGMVGSLVRVLVAGTRLGRMVWFRRTFRLGRAVWFRRMVRLGRAVWFRRMGRLGRARW